MNTLLTISAKDFNPDLIQRDISGYKTRRAARAVLLDGSGQVYLMSVGLHGYHKLPGGGIDDGEDVASALARELMEEVGCKAQVTEGIGQIIEYRDSDNLSQTSYCFLARQIGEQQASSLEREEQDEEMVVVKAKDIDAAITLLKADSPDNIEGKFIQKRDLTFLEAAKTLLSQPNG